MKKFLLSIITLLTITSTTDLKASDGAYAQVIGGAGWINSKTAHAKRADFDTGYLVGGAIGYEFCSGLSLEGEYTYRHNEGRGRGNIVFKKDIMSAKPAFRAKGHSKISTHAEMANLIWNAPITCCLKTYIGAGIGYAKTKGSFGKGTCYNDIYCYDFNLGKCRKSCGFAWQAIIGAAYPIYDNISFAVEYRFFQSKKQNNNNDLVFAANLTL